MARRLAPSFSPRIPTDDNRERRVCDHCGFVDYVNPRVVVGSVATWQGRILVCRRAIEPARGLWTLPAGFLEQGETIEAGAAREALEEAHARIETGGLISIYEVPSIAQIHFFFRARLLSPDVSPGPESLDVRLVDWSGVPWDELAFPSVVHALRAFEALDDRADVAPWRGRDGSDGSGVGSARRD